MTFAFSRDPRARRIGLHLVILLATLCTLAGGTLAAQPGPAVVDASRPDLLERARAVPADAGLRLENLRLGQFGTVDLELRRFRVFAPGARIVYAAEQRPAPRTVFFRGVVDGFPGSSAVVSMRDRGGFGGIVSIDGSYWRLHEVRGEPAGRRLEVPEDIEGAPFSCEADGASEAIADSLDPVLADLEAGSGPATNGASAGSAFSYTARVAVETDWEFLDLFGGDTTAATDYIGDLFAFASSIYVSEIDTSLEVTYVQLWPGTATDDPWTNGDYNNSGVTNCTDRLMEFRDYWRNNRTGVDRSVAHMLSGKPTGCGSAYNGVLCSNMSGFGFSGSLVGDFDPANPSPPVWDVIVVSHEIGHNFNSPHTHCYNGIPDASYPDPVDTCGTYSGCHTGTKSLPAGCPGPGQGCGTIMSYCHLLSGSYGNIAMTFGGSVLDSSSHLYGVFPERVPQRMHDHVLVKAPSGCLDPVLPGPVLTVSLAGNGSGSVSSAPAGIDCGTDCTEEYTSGAVVTLTATPDFGSAFASWTGDADCTDGVVTMTADVQCTATFDMIDADNDSYGAAVDCNDSDASVWAVPSIVGDVALDILLTTTSLSWTGQSGSAGPGTVYDVVTGSLSDLRSVGGYDAATCLASDLPGATCDDTRADPAPGAGYYYLVRARNACGSGSYGDASLPADPRDALDAAGPCP